MTKRCAHCGEAFETSSSRARYCGSTCRSRAFKERKQAEPAPDPTESDAPLVARVRADLEGAGRLDTPLGQIAMILAHRLASQGDSGAAMAAVSRELRSVLGEALSGQASGDVLDELARRRRQRAGA